MQTTTRTTLRLDPALKQQVQQLALEQNTTMQEICNLALREYLDDTNKKAAKKLVLPQHDLGIALDKLTRDDIYDDPTF